jgi:CHASE2 domain-containing sensor protein
VPMQEACKRRLYISTVLQAVANLRPKAVVLDIWFDPKLCPDPAVTQTIFQELDRLSKDTPVVVGLPSYNSRDIRANMPATFAEISSRREGLKKTQLVLQRVTHSTNPKVKEGLVERNIDARRIPLSWFVYDDFDKVGVGGQSYRRDTLSVAAVRAVDPHHPVLQRIHAVTSDGSARPSNDDYPYTSFVEEGKLPILRAIDVVCSNPPDGEWKTVCDTRPEKHCVDPTSINGKVVVLGLAGFGNDVHETLIGKIPGVVLQANYVESLLDGRVFKPVAWWLQILLGFSWLSLAFIITSKSRSLVLLLVITIVLAYPLTLVLRWCGYYTPALVELALASVTLLVSFIVHLYFEHLYGAK